MITSEFRLAALAVTGFILILGGILPILAQEFPAHAEKVAQAPDSSHQAPGEIECRRKLELAEEAIEKQKKLIAALEERVKELERELAASKAAEKPHLP